MVRFEGTLRRLAMIGEGFVEDEARLRLSLDGTPALAPKTAAPPRSSRRTGRSTGSR